MFESIITVSKWRKNRRLINPVVKEMNLALKLWKNWHSKQLSSQ